MSETPGLGWRRNKKYTVAWWLCRNDIAAAGYPIRTRALWRGRDGRKPTEIEMQEIARRCQQLQHEMLDWRWKPRARKAVRTRVQSGYVYFVRGRDAIKIGFAANVRRRIGSLQIASSESLTLLGCIKGSPLKEKQLHHRFQSLRIRGEWFLPDPRLLKFIEEYASEQVANEYDERLPEDSERPVATA